MARVWLLAATASLIAGSAGAAPTPLGRKPTLHTPDVIAPAVLPYLACLYAERGLPLLRGADGTQVAYDKSSSDCSAARAKAKGDAAKRLEGKPVPDGRTADEFIDSTLGDMDTYVSSLPIRDKSQARGQSAVIGIPVTIEDEVQPAYSRYDDCLKAQVGDSRVSADTIIAKFKAAITSCHKVRDYAVAEATNALAAKGWDEARRAHAAESTFAQVDQSWLVMAQQYREALMEQNSRGKAPAAADKPKRKVKRRS
jgi:hypothetical protein